MKLESVVYAIAGVFFGLIAGWIIGSQQAAMSPRTTSFRPPKPSRTPSTPSGSAARHACAGHAGRDEGAGASQRSSTAIRRTPSARAQLGNLYYDAGRYTDAIKWYGESLALNPKDVDVSTDLGVSYYYNNQPDLAIKQLEQSLKLNPTHTKTLLNLGVVRAFGKQDLKGATEVWRQLVEIAPDSPEGRQAKQALDSLSSAHGNTAQ